MPTHPSLFQTHEPPRVSTSPHGPHRKYRVPILIYFYTPNTSPRPRGRRGGPAGCFRAHSLTHRHVGTSPRINDPFCFPPDRGEQHSASCCSTRKSVMLSPGGGGKGGYGKYGNSIERRRGTRSGANQTSIVCVFFCVLYLLPKTKHSIK